jgi:hypothetical protein
MLKRWRLAFNPDSDYFQHRHLWVLLPGLPLHFWNEGSLKAIGNSLGQFISLDTQSLKSPSRIMGRILVAIDITTGLQDKLEIIWRGRTHQQPLDYLGLPFRCNHCRETGHLRHSCPGKFTKLVSEEEELRLNPPDYTEVDPYLAYLDSNPVHSLPSLELTDKPITKLRILCPSLYHTLTASEIEDINNFIWLSSTSGDETSPSIVDSPIALEPTAPTSLGSTQPSVNTSLTPILSADSSLHLPSNSSEPPNTILNPLPTLSASQELPGFSQPIEEEEAILDTLRSTTTPSPLCLNSITPLPTFRGKELMSAPSEASTSNTNQGSTKTFAWSRGIASEISPLQTRSSRKKKEVLTSQQPDTILPTQDGKALRALKALARSK